MWTTWNSRVERARLRLASAAVLVALAACASAGADTGSVAPDAPRPARDAAGLAPPPMPAGAQRPADRPFELRSVRLRRVGSDTVLMRLAGAELLQRAPDPVAIDVITAASLGDVARTASPEIYLDGVRVGDTWALPPDRLVAFVLDRQALRAGMAVTVAWLGNEERTRSRRPLVLTEEHFRELR